MSFDFKGKTAQWFEGYRDGAAGERSHGLHNLRIADLETDRNKLRQAVRDLTASSEKLRAVNQKAVAKALSQELVIRSCEGAIIRRNDRISILENETRKLVAELEQVRKQSSLSREKLRAALFAVGEVIAGRPLEGIRLDA